MPTASNTDLIIAAANDLTKAISETTNSSLLPAEQSESRNRLLEISNIFKNYIPPKQTNSPVPVPATTTDAPQVPNSSPPHTNPVPRVPIPSRTPITHQVPRVAAPSAQHRPGLTPAESPQIPKPLPTKATTTAHFHHLSTIRKLARKKKKPQPDLPPTRKSH